jgi:hypothetical protein
MAELHPVFIESVQKNRVWRISSFKPTGKPARVTAQEGELIDGFFKFLIYDDGSATYRRASIPVSGRATKKAIADAACELLQLMKEEELIRPDAFNADSFYVR